MKALNRAALFTSIMATQKLSNKDVAEKFGFDEKTVIQWLDPKNIEAQIPKDKLCALIDVKLLIESKQLNPKGVAALCGVTIEYVDGWMSGALPITVNAGIKLLRHGE